MCCWLCSDVDAGGETYFRRSTGCPVQSLQCTASTMQMIDDTPAGFASRPGLKIPPKQGRAIMFWYPLQHLVLFGHHHMSQVPCTCTSTAHIRLLYVSDRQSCGSDSCVTALAHLTVASCVISVRSISVQIWSVCCNQFCLSIWY